MPLIKMNKIYKGKRRKDNKNIKNKKEDSFKSFFFVINLAK